MNDSGLMNDVRITFEPFGDGRALVVALSLKGKKELMKRFGFARGYMPKAHAVQLSRELQALGLRCN